MRGSQTNPGQAATATLVGGFVERLREGAEHPVPDAPTRRHRRNALWNDAEALVQPPRGCSFWFRKVEPR